jgi:hypothetical protein
MGRAAKKLGSELIAFAQKHGIELQAAAKKDATHAGKLVGKRAMEGLKRIGERAELPLVTAAGAYGATKLAQDDEAPATKPKKKKRPYMKDDDE